ncbi:MAG: tRNA (cytidine(34)-2'-O)-methyltransferase [Candidatus Rifleibacteriota bacterium]
MSDQKCQIKNNTANLTLALIQPDIPQNTGNIARLCYATGSALVLVRPLGFRLTSTALQRAGMDYWDNIKPLILDDAEDFIAWAENKNTWYLSSHASKSYAQAEFKPGDVLVFGSESRGLPAEIYKKAEDENRLIGLPMLPEARCINLSSSAAATAYEALRQIYNWSSTSGGA